MDATTLTLSEKILLLSVRPGNGGFYIATQGVLDYALTGALILDLLLAGNLRMENKKLQLVNSRCETPAGRYLLHRMGKVNNHKSAGYWMQAFSLSKRKIRKALLEQLSEKDQLRLEPRRWLFFSWEKPILRTGHRVPALLAGIRQSVIRGQVSDEQLALVALLKPARLLRRVYSEGYERRTAQPRIRRILSEGTASEAGRPFPAAARVVAASVVSAMYART